MSPDANDFKEALAWALKALKFSAHYGMSAPKLIEASLSVSGLDQWFEFLEDVKGEAEFTKMVLLAFGASVEPNRPHPVDVLTGRIEKLKTEIQDMEVNLEVITVDPSYFVMCTNLQAFKPAEDVVRMSTDFFPHRWASASTLSTEAFYWGKVKTGKRTASLELMQVIRAENPRYALHLIDRDDFIHRRLFDARRDLDYYEEALKISQSG